ncbi:hypothetical protein GIB67_022433 [Kingdonia uniflora]|uniref:protein-serine/threonine phosphatase n=1 Tax=Kingdonia uniflora TaxID=39325 RepID=A0A7J7MU00_9MAGN|nr:hypothetical protein GIB67_022433 [Kingdonia uniflora]
MGSCLSSSGDGRSPLSYSPSSTTGANKKYKRNQSKRRNGMRRSSSFEQQLHRVPGRMFLNGSSDYASLFTQQGRKGTNQDAMIVWENFGSRTDTVFCGVFDGHGPYGHLVARQVRDSLPLKLSSHWEVNLGSEDGSKENSRMGSMNSEETVSLCIEEESPSFIDLEEKEKHPEIFSTLQESFLKAFKVMDNDLRKSSIDCHCSGTTAVTLIKQGQDLIIGNIGDSRAILGTRDQDNSLSAVQLTVDLKPNLPAEAERIKRCRGRVFALLDEPEVSRVWLPNSDSPGLAMARAFGDLCLKGYGLISVPEIYHRRLTMQDEFVVLATDGIWDVLSNQEVVEIVASAPTRATASRILVETAVRAWRLKYPTSKIDDCAVVCLFLDSKSVEEQQTALEALQEEVPTSPTEFECLRNPEIFPEEEPLTQDSSQPMGVLGDEWSALEGVSRVNTMLTLPRFVAGKDGKRSAGAETRARK